ncbi:unnamed protein product [Linum trigynum]|uniref:Uncharacterized protein n=1 Tax=Linum trigynum TaxID=586398 RepID=A0AAV2DQY4_9ROSI
MFLPSPLLTLLGRDQTRWGQRNDNADAAREGVGVRLCEAEIEVGSCLCSRLSWSSLLVQVAEEYSFLPPLPPVAATAFFWSFGFRF